MPEMTRDEMIEGLLHEIIRAQCHLEQFDEATRVTLTSLAERLGSLTSRRAAPDRRGDGYSLQNRGGIDGYSLTDSPR